MGDKTVLVVGALFIVIHGGLTLADYLSGKASTNELDAVSRTENPRRFRFNMRWNVATFFVLAVIWMIAAYHALPS